MLIGLSSLAGNYGTTLRVGMSSAVGQFSVHLESFVFDYGNVISMPQSRKDVQNLIDLTGVSADQFERIYWETREPYDRGLLDGDRYWSDFARLANTNFDSKKICELIETDSKSWSQPNWPVIDWIKQLQRRGYGVAILSNMPSSILQYLREHCSWLTDFQHAVYSCELGSIKPEAFIYQACLAKLGSLPSRALMIDDRQVNLDGASRLGMPTLLFTSLPQAKYAMKAGFRPRNSDDWD